MLQTYTQNWGSAALESLPSDWTGDAQAKVQAVGFMGAPNALYPDGDAASHIALA